MADLAEKYAAALGILTAATQKMKEKRKSKRAMGTVERPALGKVRWPGVQTPGITRAEQRTSAYGQLGTAVGGALMKRREEKKKKEASTPNLLE